MDIHEIVARELLKSDDPDGDWEWLTADAKKAYLDRADKALDKVLDDYLRKLPKDTIIKGEL